MTKTTTIALLHPGEMGAGIGGVLRELGHKVLYASEGRSEETNHRAMRAGLLDVREVAQLRDAPIVLSICPPHAAVEVARLFPGFTGIYIDANAVSPSTAEQVRATIEDGGGRYVDGGIIGGQPFGPGRTTLYLSGDHAAEVAPLFRSDHLDVGELGGPVTAASALKMAFASWTKGTNALILASRALARAYGVEDDLLAEWAGGPGSDGDESELATRSRVAAQAATTKGWRWHPEMDEIAATYRAVGLPDGFHTGAAAIFRRAPFDPAGQPDESTAQAVIDALVAGEDPPA